MEAALEEFYLSEGGGRTKKEREAAELVIFQRLQTDGCLPSLDFLNQDFSPEPYAVKCFVFAEEIDAWLGEITVQLRPTFAVLDQLEKRRYSLLIRLLEEKNRVSIILDRQLHRTTAVYKKMKRQFDRANARSAKSPRVNLLVKKIVRIDRLAKRQLQNYLNMSLRFSSRGLSLSIQFDRLSNPGNILIDQAISEVGAPALTVSAISLVSEGCPSDDPLAPINKAFSENPIIEQGVRQHIIWGKWFISMEEI